jgi:tellurite methyltransferase
MLAFRQTRGGQLTASGPMEFCMKKYYDKLYSKNNNVYGAKPLPIVEAAITYFNRKRGLAALDLGVGQARNTFYLARNNFLVDAVDKSPVAIKQVSDLLKENGHLNVQLFVDDIVNFRANKKYDLIISTMTLHFLNKNDALNLLRDIKTWLKPNGIIALTYLLDNFDLPISELEDIYNDFTIIKSGQKIQIDKGHPGNLKPHEHHMVYILCRKGTK